MIKRRGVTQTLVASAARTASGDSGSLALPFVTLRAAFRLKITAASGTTPTLDVYIQTSFDGGATWTDFAHFLQDSNFVETLLFTWSRMPAYAKSDSSQPTGDGVVGNNVILHGPIVDSRVRVKWVIAGTTPSYTFSVDSILDEE